MFAGTPVWLYPDAEAGEVQVLGVVQRQAGVVGVLQSVLELHLHRQAPPGAADHVRLLSAGRENAANGHVPSERNGRERRGRQNVVYPHLDPEMSMWACSTRSVVQTSSSPQSLKNWICREEDENRTDGWRPSGSKGHTEVTIERWRSTHRLLNRGWPALVQHRPALRLVDLEAQREADGSDVVGRVLQPTNKQTNILSRRTAPWLPDVQKPPKLT